MRERLATQGYVEFRINPLTVSAYMARREGRALTPEEVAAFDTEAAAIAERYGEG